MIANLMFGLAAVSVSTHVRDGSGLWLSESVATFGLVLVVFGLMRSGKRQLVPFAAGAYIAAAYFFTSSTSLANPAVTIGRIISNTFAGIASSSVPGFIAFQLVGAVVALAVIWALYPSRPRSSTTGNVGGHSVSQTP